MSATVPPPPKFLQRKFVWSKSCDESPYAYFRDVPRPEHRANVMYWWSLIEKFSTIRYPPSNDISDFDAKVRRECFFSQTTPSNFGVLATIPRIHFPLESGWGMSHSSSLALRWPPNQNSKHLPEHYACIESAASSYSVLGKRWKALFLNTKFRKSQESRYHEAWSLFLCYSLMSTWSTFSSAVDRASNCWAVGLQRMLICRMQIISPRTSSF